MTGRAESLPDLGRDAVRLVVLDERKVEGQRAAADAAIDAWQLLPLRGAAPRYRAAC